MLAVVIIRAIFQVYILVVIVKILLSYFTPPENKIRMTLDRLVDPLLRPIQRIIPSLAGIDFSPIVLILILQLLENLIISLL